MAKDYERRIVDLESRYPPETINHECSFTGFQKHEPTNVTTVPADCFSLWAQHKSSFNGSNQMLQLTQQFEQSNVTTDAAIRKSEL